MVLLDHHLMGLYVSQPVLKCILLFNLRVASTHPLIITPLLHSMSSGANVFLAQFSAASQLPTFPITPRVPSRDMLSKYYIIISANSAQIDIHHDPPIYSQYKVSNTFINHG